MSSEQLVLDAVKQKNASKKQSVLQKLFAVWFDAFVYNQIWEDPRVDLEALQINENSRILTISSGGCNAVNYLKANPENVTAVDLNRQHIYLLRLKIAALRFLPSHEEFFDFFGFGLNEKNVVNYYKYIAPNLDNETKRFWENNTFFGKIFFGKRISFFQSGGLYEHSRNAYFLRFFHRAAHFFGGKPEEILTAETTEEQEAYFQKYIAPFFDSFLIKIVGKLPITMFGLGVPPQQYEELKKDLREDGTIIDIYRERTKRLAVDFPIQENYFAWQAFSRKYDTKNRRAIPDYLKTENYEKFKTDAEKISAKIGSITDVIREKPENTFNRFVFLDAQDWMNAEMLTDLWTAIAEKGEKNSRIIFRTASAFSPIETNLPTNLREKFIYEKEISERIVQTRPRRDLRRLSSLYIKVIEIMENEQIIKHFYKSFAANNADKMIACYHDEVEFSDPVFGLLKGEDAKNMWKMLIERGGGNIKIEYKNVSADDKKGSADWTADYLFSKTGRKVFNRIHAEFKFKDGKIFRHTDSFDVWKWSQQALGLSGYLLGWSSFLQNKIQQNARKTLREYSAD